MPAPDLNALQQKLGYTFRDSAQLQLALTHPSIAHEQETSVQHNQRLEFLGDAVLGLVLTRELYERFPDFGEGPLTKARAELVNQRTLATQSRRLGIGDFLIMSRGELTHGGPQRASALAEQNDLFAEGVALRRQGDVSGALRAYQNFITRFPRSPLVENALVERMRVFASTRDARARAEAELYLSRYPHGFAVKEARLLTAAP